MANDPVTGWYMKNGYAECGAGWRKETAAGKKFLSLSIKRPDLLPMTNGAVNLSIVPNDNKQQENHPDFRVSVKVPDGWTPPSDEPKPTPPASIPFRNNKPYTPKEPMDLPGF